MTYVPESGGANGTSTGINEAELGAITAAHEAAFATVGDIATGAFSAFGDIGTAQANALGDTAATLADSQGAALDTLASRAVINRTTVVDHVIKTNPKSKEKAHPVTPTKKPVPHSEGAAPHKLSQRAPSPVVTHPKVSPHPTQPAPKPKAVTKPKGGGGGARVLHA